MNNGPVSAIAASLVAYGSELWTLGQSAFSRHLIWLNMIPNLSGPTPVPRTLLDPDPRLISDVGFWIDGASLRWNRRNLKDDTNALHSYSVATSGNETPVCFIAGMLSGCCR